MQLRSLGQEDPLEEGRATLQRTCLGNPTDRGAWQATVQGCKELTEQLSTHVLYILVYTSPLAAGDEEKVTSHTRILPAVLSYGDQSPWW